MRRKTNLPELLAPAGDFESLVAAVKGGADAVYVGAKSFSARAFAKNFSADELVLAVEYCHLHGVKLYVTVNTLVYDKEFSALMNCVASLWEAGVDALIVADIGAVKEIKRVYPDFEIHASTQMSVHNTEGADFAAKLGCVRAVPARELSFEDIKTITEKSRTEIEIFLHGALCVSYSGQCLMSSLVGGRSGNRGECAQPCRLPYNKNSYPLSLKDLSLCDYIPEIIDSGVSSLKIEGRMKSPEYVYRVTRIYRRLLDGERRATKEEKSELTAVFSRDGFTDGYFLGKPGKNMTGVRSESDKERTREIKESAFAPERKKVRAEVKIKLSEPAEMTLILGDKKVKAIGAPAEAAQNAPLNSADVKARLSKMGNTFLSLGADDIDLELDEGVNLPVSAINSLRREAAALMQSQKRKPVESYIPCEIKIDEKYEKRYKSAQFFNINTLNGLLSSNNSPLSKFDYVFAPLFGFEKLISSVNGVYLPPVIFDSQLSEVEEKLIKAVEKGAKYALCGNIGAIELSKRCGLIPIGDFRLNVTNKHAKEALSAVGVEHIVLSPELTPPMARDIGGAVIVSGRIPLMLTERCFMKENFGCGKCSECALTDRKGARFPMIREYPHRNVIFNSAITYMGDRKDELKKHSLFSEHFIFSVEKTNEALDILFCYETGRTLVNSKSAVRRIGRRDN